MKKVLKWLFYLVGIPLIVIGLIIFTLWFKYYLVVSVEPGQLEVSAKPGELGQWVNPFIGTGGIPWVCAHNFPGATMPFGMVRLSPETVSMITDEKALNTSGYYYPDGRMTGFSHTRLAGTGATDGGHFLVTPVNDDIEDGDEYEEEFLSYSHSDEVAFPGYYAVHLPGPDVLVELTATERVGIHRYTFTEPENPTILINITNALGGKRSDKGVVRLDPKRQELEGSVRTFGSFGGRYGGANVYFAARFDQPLQGYGTWNGGRFKSNARQTRGDEVGAYLTFAGSKESRVVQLYLAISYVSIENARKNLEIETANAGFEEALELAKSAWEEKLSLVTIEEANKNLKTIYYSALYHVFQMPTIFTDVNEEYIGFDNQKHQAEGFQYYTDLSIWDTFRNVHPLFVLLDPAAQRDMLVSLVEMSKQGGDGCRAGLPEMAIPTPCWERLRIWS